MTLPKLKTVIRALAVSLALGATSLAAVPVQAGSPGFNFNFEFGNGEFGFGNKFPQRLICLTDRQIRRAIGDRGYHDVYLNVPNGQYIEVRATKGKWVYLINFNYCTNDIIDRDRLRRS